eukprot:4224796-Alexandrium_andersonii.AAC.1
MHGGAACPTRGFPEAGPSPEGGERPSCESATGVRGRASSAEVRPSCGGSWSGAQHPTQSAQHHV